MAVSQALLAGCGPGVRLQPARQRQAALRAHGTRAARNGPPAVVPAAAAAARCRRRLPPPPRASQTDPEAELALLERELGAEGADQDQVAIGKAAAAATNRCGPRAARRGARACISSCPAGYTTV